MPNLINTSFFVRDINLVNVTDAKILERINSFITKYEPQCLLNILGYPLYKLFGTESSVRMTSILSGQEYTCNGEVCKWRGLVHDTDQSLIAYYIYFFFQEASATQTTGVSTAVKKTEAGVSVSPADKMVNAWNNFSSETYELISFLWNYQISSLRVYPEFSSTQFWVSKEYARPINIFGF